MLTYKLPTTDVYPLSRAFYKLEAGKNKLLKDLESNIIQDGCAIHFLKRTLQGVELKNSNSNKLSPLERGPSAVAD